MHVVFPLKKFLVSIVNDLELLRLHIH